MKKILFLSILVMSLLLIFTTISCKKDKENENQTPEFDISKITNNLPIRLLEDYNLPNKVLDNDVEYYIDNNKVEKISVDKTGVKTINLLVKSNSKEANLNITTYPYTLDEINNEVDLPTSTINDLTFITTLHDNYLLSYTSNHPEIIANDGKFTKPSSDTMVDIKVKISLKDDNKINKEYSHEIKALSKTKEEIRQQELAELEAISPTFVASLNSDLIDSIKLPNTIDGHDDIEVEWYEDGEEALITRNKTKVLTYNLTYRLHFKDSENYYEGTHTFNVYPKTFKAVSTDFESQMPKEITADVDYLEDNYNNIYSYEWHSSDTSVFTDSGIYIKPEVDTNVTISLRISIIGKTNLYYDTTIEVVVKGKTDAEKIDVVYEWLRNEVENELAIDSDIPLPNKDPIHNVDLTWTTSNKDIIDLDGHVTRYVYDRYVEVICNISIGIYSKQAVFWFKVKALDTSSMTPKQIAENYIKAMAVSELKHVNFNVDDGYANITQSFGVISFFANKWEPVISHICPASNDNRPGTIRDKVFVVVHDTANNSKNANGMAHAKYVDNGGGGTSFHYVVGNDGIYNLIPDNEVAYHAGDGTAYQTKLYDTGVRALTEQANIGISPDDYFTFNGVKSKIKIPADTTSRRIASAGLYYEIGSNGNYWLNENYFNTHFDYISNRGGNNNSIGIETCVDTGSDYYLTYMLNANNVARLCTNYNIPVDRVMQHNNFSGKDCPYAIRHTHTWQAFRDFVSQIKFGMANFEGYTFEYNSNSEILGNDGFIRRASAYPESVSYHITVKDASNNVLIDNNYLTKLIP